MLLPDNYDDFGNRKFDFDDFTEKVISTCLCILLPIGVVTVGILLYKLLTSLIS